MSVRRAVLSMPARIIISPFRLLQHATGGALQIVNRGQRSANGQVDVTDAPLVPVSGYCCYYISGLFCSLLPTCYRYHALLLRLQFESMPRLVDELMPRLVDELMPRLVDELMPRLVDESMPRLVDESMPRLVDTTYHLVLSALTHPFLSLLL